MLRYTLPETFDPSWPINPCAPRVSTTLILAERCPYNCAVHRRMDSLSLVLWVVGSWDDIFRFWIMTVNGYQCDCGCVIRAHDRINDINLNLCVLPLLYSLP